MSDDTESLEGRVAALEREVAALRARVMHLRPQPEPPVPARHAADVFPRGASPDFEEDVIGRWFPRLGALALLIGAAFGFKYAVDQGWFGPGVRVTIGFSAGIALVLLGEWTRGREWTAYASH
jgi:uncharacterized membrane protein